MQFLELASFFEQLDKTSSRNEMVRILAELFSKLNSEEIEKVVYLSQGRVSPHFIPLEIGMGEKLVAQAVAEAYGLTKEEVLTEFERLGDMGLAAEVLGKKKRKKEKARELTITDVYKELYEIATTSGAGTVEKRVGILKNVLEYMEPLSARYLVRIPLGTLRLGVGDPTILDGLSYATAGDKSLRGTLEIAYNRTSDLGFVGKVFWEMGIEAVKKIKIQVGKPIRPELAERLPSPQAVIDKLGKVAVQPKFDGFRVQLHKKGDQVHIYSRNLEDMTGMFPELIQGVQEQAIAKEVILDAEALAYHPESEEFYPFQETTKRRRKYGIEEMAEKLPLKAFVFDILFYNGQDLTSKPYKERQQFIKKSIRENSILFPTPQEIVSKTKELSNLLDDAIQKGLEGVVVKRLDSIYEAGTRNFNWVKLKRATSGHLTDTVDCVILGYIYGKGKRTAFGAGALLVGVYDDQKDSFVTVSKIGTGLTDEEWTKIKELTKDTVTLTKPARVASMIVPSVWVKPKIVIEVLADEVTRSPIHTAGKQNEEPGYALRFPRLIKFREDKSPEDVTTVTEIIEMFKEQGRRK
ncbi:MAG: ATP-dependent DNA ligase [Patescibacteria group bacterium]|nr:ATP-dependent DNA ligase [Patescibacteria group bacterium]